MGTGGSTPHELERLLEDAVVLRDAAAVVELFETAGVLVAGRGGPVARGGAAIARAAPQLWAGGRSYVADPGRVLLVDGLALVTTADGLTVARRGADGLWRYAVAVVGGAAEEERMYTVVVRMATDPQRREQVVAHLRDDVVPWATSRPGFVSGHWNVAPDGERGTGVLVFASADAAEAAAEAPRSYPRDPARAWNIDAVELYEQVAAASGADVTLLG